MELFDDQRTHPPKGLSRSFRLPKVTLPGGGFISKGEDGRVAVAGRESLRILRVSDTQAGSRGGASKIESTRNLWEGSGLKIDCASTDVAWAYGVFNNKILTSARNGELIMWDMAKNGHTKFERRTKEHLRSIHTMSVSRVVHHYCMTGSADGDFRVWDLRDIQSSVMRVHNPSAIRRVIFSPCLWNPLFVLVGMDNGTLHRWDLKMGQRGLLDRLPVAHTAPITSIDWYSGTEQQHSTQAISFSGQQGPDDYTGNTLGWVASAGLDRCVKIWDLTGPEAVSHMPNKPTHTLHPSYPIRRILWRPNYECELAVVSHADFTVSSHVDHHLHTHQHPGSPGSSGLSSGLQSRAGSGLGLDSVLKSIGELKLMRGEVPKALSSSASLAEQQQQQQQVVVVNGVNSVLTDAVEIWDVRRSWVPKWGVSGTSVEGGVTDVEFADPYTLLAQNTNGTFTRLDMRDMSRPLDAISRTATTWTPSGALAFVTDNAPRWEVPYDDIHPSKLNNQELMTLMKHPPPIKHIGDRPFRPKTQKVGAFNSVQSQFEGEVFVKLAKEYVIEGDDPAGLCMKNMQAVMNVGKPHVAQLWLLMATSLEKRETRSMLPTPPRSPRMARVASLGNIAAAAARQQQHAHHHHPHRPHHVNVSTPTSLPTPGSGVAANYSFPSTTTPTSAAASASHSRSPELSRPPVSAAAIRGSPSYHFPSTPNSSSSAAAKYRSPSTSKRHTPASSNSSSPLHLSTPLPAVQEGGSNSNGAMTTPRRGVQSAYLGRRESIDSGVSRRGGSMLRRQSVSVHRQHRQHPGQSASPVERDRERSVSVSVKYAGEVEDPETDDERDDDDDDTVGIGGIGAEGGSGGVFSDGEEGNVLGLGNLQKSLSPLARFQERERERRRWITTPNTTTVTTPMEGVRTRKDGYLSSSSASPGSTDTEDEGEDTESLFRRGGSKGGRRMSMGSDGRVKHRSRNSTLASLPANAHVHAQRQAPTLSLKHGSQSSTRTIMAIETGEQTSGLGGDERRDEDGATATAGPATASTSRHRGGSAKPSLVKEKQQAHHSYEHENHHHLLEVMKAERVTKRREEIVKVQEERMGGYVWEVVRVGFEELLVVGDVQTAATMAVVAPRELGLSTKRRLHIFDTYIDQLFRCQLYTTAAYFRKHSQVQQIKNMTLLDTTIYTLCGGCKKPIVKPTGHSLDNPVKRPTYSYCLKCKAPTVRCTICRLPVRNMLFQCSICHHGGHQSCYRQYYLNQPMVDIPPVSLDQQRGRSATRTPSTDPPSGGSSSSYSPASPGVQTKLGGRAELAGHPCAAGCGHYCWATLK
ncbi:hypothetical protein D9756_010921 [Leucocoprinus leucothites]|uniref:WDR59/RTC1-like RING zinc finger domain-containing protein n=1 Tax=Leucocoprinus leucothites TaxID=201217 RepID=A0A8H5CRZ8_9AGAR|nr:hypothetical protein D9756_010921 [Leucoagaricus leucothites]